MRALCPLTVLAMGCFSGAKPMTTLPRCTTISECRTYDHQRVEVVGFYRVWSPSPDRAPDDPKSRQVRIALDDSNGPFLEAGSDRRHKRATEEIAKFRDRRVRVVGTFMQQMPPLPPDRAQLRGSCISDIESIALDD